MLLWATSHRFHTADTRMESVSDVCVVDNDDELWLVETDYKSGWVTRFKNRAYNGVPSGVVLRDHSKKKRSSHPLK